MNNPLKLERLERENMALKEEITTLEGNVSKLKDEMNLVINYSQDTKKAILKIRELEETNFDLRSLVQRKEHEFKMEKRSLESKYETEINKLKGEIQLINHKYDTMMRYELYINKIEEINKELSERITEMDKNFEQEIKNEEKKYEIKLGLIQQKTLNILGESKKNIQNTAVENLNNSYKLIMLQVNELHHQLCEQSAMLEELLKQINKKDKIIHELRINMNVYKEVDRIIIMQNRKLSKMIKRLLENKRLTGNTKEYVEESKKFLNILKNEVKEDEEEELGIDFSQSNNFISNNFSMNNFESNNSNNNHPNSSRTNPNVILNKEIMKLNLMRLNSKITELLKSPEKSHRKDTGDINKNYFSLNSPSRVKPNTNSREARGNTSPLKTAQFANSEVKSSIKSYYAGVQEAQEGKNKNKNSKSLLGNNSSRIKFNSTSSNFLSNNNMYSSNQENSELISSNSVAKNSIFNKIKGKSYNSSLADDMNSTTEFGSTFYNSKNQAIFFLY